MGRSIGLLGGTFDPPHLGHLILAQTAAAALNLDQVLFLPVGQPTHKTTMTPAAHRIAMTRLAIADNPAFVLDTADIDRPPPHYTADLLPIVQKTHPTADLWLILGGDSLRDFPTWHAPEQILTQCRLAVLPRPQATIDWVTLHPKLPTLRGRTTLLQGPSVDISSTWLRQQLAAGGSVRYLVPPAVERYITEEGVY